MTSDKQTLKIKLSIAIKSILIESVIDEQLFDTAILTLNIKFEHLYAIFKLLDFCENECYDKNYEN